MHLLFTVDLRNQVEVEQFLAELRKSIVAAGTTQTKEQCKCCETTPTWGWGYWVCPLMAALSYPY